MSAPLPLCPAARVTAGVVRLLVRFKLSAPELGFLFPVKNVRSGTVYILVVLFVKSLGQSKSLPASLQVKKESTDL